MKRVEKGNVMQTFNDSVGKILEIAPQMRNNLLRYFMDVVFADGELEDNELKLIYDFGDKIGFSQSEIAHALSIKIREDFMPLASGLKL